jgi:hypothetical protein
VKQEHSVNWSIVLESTPSQEALGLIVEVFRDGHRAAVDLRRSAAALTPGELRIELESIERAMISQITSICESYRSGHSGPPRN